MTATPNWITMAAALGFGGGRPIVPQDFGTNPQAETHKESPVLAVELTGRASSVRLEKLLSDSRTLRSGLLIKTEGPAVARALQRQGMRFAEVAAYGVLVDYYTSHIAFSPGEAAMLRYCLGLRRNPGVLAAGKRLIKQLLTCMGLGRLLYDYCLVYLEKCDVDR